MSIGDVFEVDLTAPAYGGESLGRLPDGRALFVPFALPGERVRVRIIEEKRGFARAALETVLTPAPERIAPRCRHFGVCGGCHYQMLPYPRQLEMKQAVLRDTFQRIAAIPDPPVEPVRPSPAEWNYRNSLQLHLSPAGRVGFLRAGSDEVVEIRECHLPEAALAALWPQLDFEPGAPLERISLRTGSDEEALLALESDEADIPNMVIDLDISVVHLSGDDSVVLAGEDTLVYEVLGHAFRVSGGSFFQVNTAQAAALVSHVLDGLALAPDQSVLDLYSGVGLFSAFLAPRVAQVTGIEISPAACEDFAVNLDEFENVTLYEGAAEQVLPELGLRPHAAVVDPPRAGLERAAVDALLALHPARLVYVSCDPATLARDAKRLIAGGYRLERVTPFDMFPQTYHIESVSLFTWQGTQA